MARSSGPSRRAERLHAPSEGRLGLKMRFSSLENIASKLAKLEKEWSVLGPNREIIFYYRLGNLKSAEIFASIVEEKGCQSRIEENYPNGVVVGSGDYEWYVSVSMIMEPLATNVIFWQELLDSLAD